MAITGAANGIGLAIARSFLEAGAGVLALDLDPVALAGMKEEAPDRIRTIAVTSRTRGSPRGGRGRARRPPRLRGRGRFGEDRISILEPRSLRLGTGPRCLLMGVVNTVHASFPRSSRARPRGNRSS